MLPIMLVLCSNMNDIDAKFYYLSAQLEYLRYKNRGLSAQMQIRQHIESELGKLALNSNQTHPHVIRIIVPHK